MQDTSNIYAETFAISTSGVFHPMEARPMAINITDPVLHDLGIQTSFGTDVKLNTITEAIKNTNLGSLTGSSLGQVAINGGAGTDRPIMTMVLVDRLTQRVHYVHGHVSPGGVTYNPMAPNGGHIDDHAQLTFNCKLTIEPILDHNRNIIGYKHLTTDDILIANSVNGAILAPMAPGMGMPTISSVSNAMRPEDLLKQTAFGLGKVSEVITNPAEAFGAQAVDLREQIDLKTAEETAEESGMVNVDFTNIRQAVFGYSGHGIPVDHLALTLNSFTNARSNLKEDPTAGLKDIAAQASCSRLIKNNIFNQDSLMSIILDRIHNRMTATCSYLELKIALPGIDNIRTIQADPASTRITNQMQWGSGYRQTPMCQELIGGIRSAAASSGVLCAKFMMSTERCKQSGAAYTFALIGDGQIKADGSFIQDQSKFDRRFNVYDNRINSAMAYQDFTAKLMEVVFPQAMKGFAGEIQVLFDLYGDTTVMMTLVGEAPFTYTLPCFASALWNPQSAVDGESFKNLAYGMGELAKYLGMDNDGVQLNQNSNLGLAQAALANNNIKHVITPIQQPPGTVFNLPQQPVAIPQSGQIPQPVMITQNVQQNPQQPMAIQTTGLPPQQPVVVNTQPNNVAEPTQQTQQSATGIMSIIGNLG